MFTGFVAIFIFPTVKDGIITSLIYNVNPHQSNAALSFPASEQEKRTHNTLYVLFLYVKSNIIL